MEKIIEMRKKKIATLKRFGSTSTVSTTSSISSNNSTITSATSFKTVNSTFTSKTNGLPKSKVNDLTLTISKNENSRLAALLKPSVFKEPLMPMKTFGFKSKMRELFN